jgi:hypothetical protein
VSFSSLLLADLRRKFGYAEAGRLLNMVASRQQYGSCKSVSVTCTTDLTRPGGIGISNPREQSNTAADFLQYVINLLAHQVPCLSVS